MISVHDTVHVAAPPSEVWRFLRTMESHYREWHPEHLDWRNLRGDVTTPGGIVFADEWVGSHRLQARFFAAEVVDERLLRYTIGWPYSLIGAGGSFEIAPTSDGGCRFTAEVHCGSRLPVVGQLLDGLLAIVFPVDELRHHMREEGEHLARLVQTQSSANARQASGRIRGGSMTRTPFTLDEAAAIARELGIIFESAAFDLDQFLSGINVELEHGTRDPATNVTNDDPLVTGKVALAHLNEMPDYYTRLAAMEAAAERPTAGDSASAASRP